MLRVYRVRLRTQHLPQTYRPPLKVGAKALADVARHATTELVIFMVGWLVGLCYEGQLLLLSLVRRKATAAVGEEALSFLAITTALMVMGAWCRVSLTLAQLCLRHPRGP